MRNIFVTSDTFFGRIEILNICNRPFRTINEMNEVLVKNWNNVVKENDIVYHLGNLAWSVLDIKKYLTQLNGHIKLILGDYDDSIIEYSDYVKDKLEIIPNDFYKEKKTGVVLSHWPMLDWPGKNKGVFHFHGHSLKENLTNLKEANRVNVCCDNWNYEPKEIKVLLELFNEFKK